MADSDCDPNYKDAAWAYYRFEPSVAANTVFMILFILTTGLHLVQLWRTRTWYLSALVTGGCCEVVGSAGRLINAREDPGCWTLGLYVMQNLVILIALALMAASIYMILGRIILLTEGEHLALIKRHWLTKIFVIGDVVSLLLQGSGGGLMAPGDNHKTGETVIIGVFSPFQPAAQTRSHLRASDPCIRWQAHLITLYVTGVLIWVRSLFRVIEFIQGNDGQLMRSEVYVFVFDGLLMFVVLAWMNWFHPGEIGLLLRGSQLIPNGLVLLKMGGRVDGGRDSALESLPSDNSVMAASQGR